MWLRDLIPTCSLRSPYDKGKIVNNLVSISLYLFCIFLFIFMVYVCFSALGLIWKIMEEMSINKSKRAKICKNL